MPRQKRRDWLLQVLPLPGIMTTPGTPSLTDELPNGEGLMVTTRIRGGQRLLFIPVTAVRK